MYLNLISNLLLASSALAAAVPASHHPEFAYALSKEDVREMGRFARLINAAHCPSHRHLNPSHSTSSRNSRDTDAVRHSKKAEKIKHSHILKLGLERGSQILTSSHDNGVSFDMNTGEVEEKNDVDWFIAHTPASQTITLSMSSLTSTDDFLSLLTDAPSTSTKQSQKPLSAQNNYLLAPLPEILFPEFIMQQQFPAGTPRPAVHTAIMEPLLKHGPGLVLQLLELLETTHTSVMVDDKDELIERNEKIETLVVAAHGLGSAVSLLVALSVHLHLIDPVRAILASSSTGSLASKPTTVVSVPKATTSGLTKIIEDITSAASWSPMKRSEKKGKVIPKEKKAKSQGVRIEASLFGMSRVGDEVFARWVDRLVMGTEAADATSSAPVESAKATGKVIGSFPVGSNDLANSPTSTLGSGLLSISRINSFADPVPHLPAIWQGFSHFRTGEKWVDGDPRLVWACSTKDSGSNYENDQCTNSMEMEKTSMLDHAGPYGGVWIGSESCQ